MNEEKLSSIRIMTIVTTITNFGFLFAHLLYLIIFLISKIYPLVYVNIFCMILYGLLFLFIKNKKFEIYALICGIEITIHMTAVTILFGFNPGFQLCLFGLCILAFVTKYFLNDKKLVIHPLIMSAIFVIDYIGLYIFTKYNNPVYQLSSPFNSILLIFHSIMVFAFCIIFMYVFLVYVLKLEKRILNESRIDKLTKLPNRNYLQTYFESLDKSNYVLAIFDIDDFKEFNDKYGHLCGDYILQEVANIALENSNSDFISRWGGEEFVIISKIDDNLENTYKKIDLIRSTIENYNFQFNNMKLKTTITIGVAKYENNINLEEWISIADKKLYEGKNSGKNKIVF